MEDSASETSDSAPATDAEAGTDTPGSPDMTGESPEQSDQTGDASEGEIEAAPSPGEAPGAAGASADAPAEGTTSDAGEPQTDEQGAASAEGAGSTENGGAAALEIGTEERTTIRQTIVEQDVEPAVDVDFDVVVGTQVPDTVVLYDLPPRVIEIVPQYQGYRYFVLEDGTIVIVRPQVLEIVYIIEA